jgi:hypothetical protein
MRHDHAQWAAASRLLTHTWPPFCPHPSSHASMRRVFYAQKSLHMPTTWQGGRAVTGPEGGFIEFKRTIQNSWQCAVHFKQPATPHSGSTQAVLHVQFSSNRWCHAWRVPVLVKLYVMSIIGLQKPCKRVCAVRVYFRRKSGKRTSDIKSFGHHTQNVSVNPSDIGQCWTEYGRFFKSYYVAIVGYPSDGRRTKKTSLRRTLLSTPQNIQGIMEQSGNNQGTIGEQSGNNQGTFTKPLFKHSCSWTGVI